VAAILFFVVLIATFVTMVLIPPLVRLAEWLHMADIPSERKVHKAPIPRLGGLAMATGALLPLIMWAPMNASMIGFLCGVAIILFFGAWDDIKGIGYRLKFLGQFIAVLVVVLYGGVVIRYLPFLGLEPLSDYLAIPLTVIALVGVTNATNLADGLDGLAGGITLLSLGIMAILAYATPDFSVVLACAAVIGSIVGFLRFNTYPARIFMGDGGSQFLGFSAGVLVIVLTQQSNTALSPALPIVILGLPILDTVMVMIERLNEGRSPFLPDKNHIHHKLLALGFDHYEAVFVIYLLQSLLVAAAYFLRFQGDWLILALYGLFCIALVGFLKTAAAAGWRAHSHRHEPGTPIVPGWVQWLRSDQRILKMAFYVALIAIPSYLLLGAFFVEGVPRDIGALACVLLVVLLALYFRHRHKPFSMVERACAYIAGICVVYLVQVRPGALADFDLYRNMLFVVMTVAVLIGFRFSNERFRITPMDFLVVFLAVVVPNLPDFGLQGGHVGMGVAMLIVLFYGIELVLNNIWRRWDMMRFTTYITLAVLGLRGVIGALG
jgi:UDP-GlcNAc:undecaprenyl-phosphate/decaprenyl-phosphate GlcNAc-1-phosphate transferase